MQAMFPGIPNSPSTTLSNDITNSQTTITVTDPSKLPSAPNEATIGTGEDAETILYTGKSGNDLIGCTRGFEGTAKAWVSGTSIGRNFTNYDYSSIIANILEHINDDAEHGQFYRQAIINGGCQVAQDIAKTLSTTPQYGSVDMFSVKATGTAVSAGAITQVTNSTAGTTGYVLAITGVTITGTGILYTRYRMEAKDAVKLKNQLASFSCAVYHDVGSNIDYTIYVRKPTASDNYAGVTEIANSGAISVPNVTATTIKFENISLGDVSYGIEIEILISCGAITTKNFHFTEFQFNKGSIVLPFTSISLSNTQYACQEYYYRSWNEGVVAPNTGSVSGVSSATNNIICSFRFPTPMRIAPTLQIRNDNTDKQVRVTATNAKVSFTTVNYAGNRKGFSYLYDSGTPFTVGTYYDFDLIADARL